MTLAPGTRLGTYDILTLVGSGGMGEVYRAHDTKLNRDVALKVLPDVFVLDPDRLARFKREAQVLASLNHPNIAAIYGFEESNGVQALVLELVEGPTLADRVAQGAIPLDEALPIARQIAEALEAAHEQGIVHRDLKPANVKVRPDGTVKVLDFGLAKALEPTASASGAAVPANSPTLTIPAAMTAAGVILGTAAYMAPEQARGRAVDKRADIWAFGCLLYELLTGVRAFGGEDISETLAAVLKDSVPLDRLPGGTPDSIRRLLARCLERDPKLRLRDIGEARILLAASHEQQTPPPRVSTSRRTLAVVAAAGVALATVVGSLAWRAKPTTRIPVRRFELPADIAAAGEATLSPDGTRIAYLFEGHLHVRALDALTSQDLGAMSVTTEGLIWSPDSRTLGFTAEGSIRSVPASGGPVFTICKVPVSGRTMALAWRPDGAIVFAVWRGSLYEVRAKGGEPHLLLKLDPRLEVDIHHISALPDNRLILRLHLISGDVETYRHELFDGTRRRVLSADKDVGVVAYAPPGYLLLTRMYANQGIWALPFSEEPLDLTKAMLVEPGALLFDAAADGTLLVGLQSAAGKSDLVWVDRAGSAVPVTGSPIDLSAASGASRMPSIALSPDGRRVAFVAQSPPQLFVRDLQSGVDTRLTFEAALVAYPAWFPSGEQILFRRSSVTTRESIAVKRADGSGGVKDITVGNFARLAPDGRTLLFLSGEPGRSHLRYAPIQADGTIGGAQPVFPGADEPDLAWFDLSPDGRLIAYQVTQPNLQADVLLTEFPSSKSRWEVAAGATRPRFSADGRELFYMSGSMSTGRPLGLLMVVPVTVEPSVTLGSASTLFTFDGPNGPTGDVGFDVSRDGRRFIMARSLRMGGRDAPHLVLVQNWFAAMPSK